MQCCLGDPPLKSQLAPIPYCPEGFLECSCHMAADFDLKPKRFVTEDLPERDRLARWREEFGRTIVGVDIMPSATDVPFWAEAVLQILPGVHVATCAGSRATMDRTSALVAADTGADHTVGIINTASAPMPVVQHGAELMLGQGDAVLIRHDEACAINTVGHVGLVLPRAALAPRTDDLDGAVMKRISRDNPALRLLLNYIQLIQSDPELSELAINAAIGDHIHDLAAMALGAGRDVRERGRGAVVAARLAATFDYNGGHFAEPSLPAARLATAPDAVVDIAKLYGLTATEVRVLDTLLKVNGVRAMADTLGLSQATVKTHLQNLFRKTGTARQSDLVKLVAGI
jgi:DNA-binding CsgD family transcriptional regulator